MSDARTDELGDEDRLPWLEAVEEDEREEGPSAAKLIAWIVVGLIAIAVIVGGLFWAGNRGQPGANGELIAAPEGDYKVKPGDPGGMAVEGEGDTAFAASEGAEPKGQLNTNAVPETPVTRTPPAQQPQPKAPPAQRPAPAQPAPQPQAAGPTIQLGAFSTQAGANRAWTALSGRFRYLSPLSHSVVPVQSGGRTLYRLRASGADSAGICRRLQVAGEACSIVG
jgi:hypothetical protein